MAYISGTDEATLFEFSMWIVYGKSQRRDEKFPLKGAWSGSRVPFNNFKPPSIFLKQMKYTLFKFGTWIDYGKSHRRDDNFPTNGAWSGSRDSFKDFKPPSIFLEWMKLRCLNLASK